MGGALRPGRGGGGARRRGMTGDQGAERAPTVVSYSADNARRTASGSRRMTVRNARAAPVGARRPVRGFEVDDAARAVIRARGYGDRFVHRTGHSIGEEVHANGVHLDNLETCDERRLLDGTLVSVEPGVYLGAFGVRSEVNLLVDEGEAVVTPERCQRELPALLA